MKPYQMALVIVLAIIIILVGFVFILKISLSSPTSSSTPTNSYQINNDTTRQQQITFPDCFDSSPSAKNAYSTLKANQLEKKYSRLLDVYSQVLCQIQDFRRSCSEDTLIQRISILSQWYADDKNTDAIAIVNAITRLKNNNRAKFLVQSCDLCEKQLQAIESDTSIPKDVKTYLRGINSEFYRYNFDLLNTMCP